MALSVGERVLTCGNAPTLEFTLIVQRTREIRLIDLRADPGSWLAVDAAPERDDLRAAARVTDVGSYR